MHYYNLRGLNFNDGFNDKDFPRYYGVIYSDANSRDLSREEIIESIREEEDIRRISNRYRDFDARAKKREILFGKVLHIENLDR